MPLNISKEQKARIIERRIVHEVAEFHKAFAKGFPMNKLSMKYGRALKDCGGFPEVIASMAERGLIRVEPQSSTARHVWPGSGEIQKPKASDFF